MDHCYACDTEFFKLLTRGGDVDLTTAALELARDAYPGIVFQQTYDWIAACAAELAGVAGGVRREREMLSAVGGLLAGEKGIFGDPVCFEEPDGSYLHRVIASGRGIPISLSLLYAAVGQRLGIELQGVCAPAHFLLRYEGVSGPLFVDAYSGGKILTHEECRGWLGGLTGLPEEIVDGGLEPAAPREIIIRMLNNLKRVYAGRENWAAAWSVQHRLTALQPASYQQRKDLAFISLQAQRPGEAVDVLESCRRTCPREDAELLEAWLREAQGRLADWN